MSREVVFVDVDTQVDFMRPDGAFFVPGADDLVGNLKALVALAEAKAISIVASMDTHVSEDPELEAFPLHCMRGTPGHEKIRETSTPNARWVGMETGEIAHPAAVALHVEKHGFSLFDNPNAEAILTRLGAAEHVVFGVATDYCVKATVLGMRERGLAVTVVTDAIAAATPEGGAEALAEMAEAGARFSTTEDILARY